MSLKIRISLAGLPLKILLEETKTGTNTYRKLLYKEIEDLIDSFDAASKSHSKGKTQRKKGSNEY